MTGPRGLISFLSDYGLEDEFVGLVHLAVARVAPTVAVIDIHHQIRSHDVASGAMTLWRAAPYLAPGVILAVVDPGVGGDRRDIAVHVAQAEAYLVGPDNGLLLPAALRLGPITGAVAIEEIHPPVADRRAGRTFAGRDILAPAAARLALGVPLHRIGSPLDPATLAGGPVPVAEPTPEGLKVTVTWVDHFGNAQLNARAEDGPLDGRVTLKLADQAIAVRTVPAYTDLAAGQVGLVVDAYGMLSVSVFAGSAAARLGLHEGDQAWLVPEV